MSVNQAIADYGVAIGFFIIAIGLLATYFYKHMQKIDRKFEDDREERKYDREQKTKHDELLLEAERDKLEAEREARRTYLGMTEELKKSTLLQAEIIKQQAIRLDSYSDRIDKNTDMIESHTKVFESYTKSANQKFDCVDSQLVGIAEMLEEIKESTSDLATKADIRKVQSGLDEYIRSKKD